MPSLRKRVFRNILEEEAGYFIRNPKPLYSDTSYVAVVRKKDYAEMQDVVTPNFFKRMRAGELIVNPLYKYEEQVTCGGGSLTMTRISPPGPNDSFSGYYTGPSITQHIGIIYGNAGWTLPLLSYVNRESDAKLNALQGILAPKARLMEDVLEMKSTISTLGNPLRSIHDIAKEMYKKRVLDGAAKAWLSYAMEFRPLYQSLCDLHDGLLHAAGQFNSGVRLRATGIAFDSQGGAKTEAVGSAPAITYTTSLNVHTKWRAVVYYRVKTPVKIDLQQYLGLRARDVPTGIWNVVGYSFLVDRVANVSRSLNALTNLMDPNVVVEGGCVTRDESRVETAQAINIASDPSLSRTVNGDLYTKTTQTRVRQPWTPSVVDITPPVYVGGIVDSATKVLDLAALAQQALARSVPRHNQKALSKLLPQMSKKASKGRQQA